MKGKNSYELYKVSWTTFPMLYVEFRVTSFFGSSQNLTKEIFSGEFVVKFGKSRLPKKPKLLNLAFSLDSL